MTALEALQSVQYVTAKGRRFAVVPVEEWETLIAWLEDREDQEAVRQAYADLEQAGGDRRRAGWLAWDDVKDEL